MFITYFTKFLSGGASRFLYLGNETGCHDRIDPDTGFPEKCISLKGLGCEKNLKELAEALEQPYPEDKPPEARVKDACPFTCGVCGGKSVVDSSLVH